MLHPQRQHPAGGSVENLNRKIEQYLIDKGSGVFYDGKAIHTIEAVSHVTRSSYSQPFDTALQPYSGQAVDLQEATSEPGISVAEYCLVIS